MGSLHAAWQKSFHDDDAVDPVEGSSVVALSAFLLSSLPTPVDRKILIKEMWESGAEIIVCASVFVWTSTLNPFPVRHQVLIDHSFEDIAEAREQLLKLGKKELEVPMASGPSLKGAHVVAPVWLMSRQVPMR